MGCQSGYDLMRPANTECLVQIGGSGRICVSVDLEAKGRCIFQKATYRLQAGSGGAWQFGTARGELDALFFEVGDRFGPCLTTPALRDQPLVRVRRRGSGMFELQGESGGAGPACIQNLRVVRYLRVHLFEGSLQGSQVLAQGSFVFFVLGILQPMLVARLNAEMLEEKRFHLLPGCFEGRLDPRAYLFVVRTDGELLLEVSYELRGKLVIVVLLGKLEHVVRDAGRGRRVVSQFRGGVSDDDLVVDLRVHPREGLPHGRLRAGRIESPSNEFGVNSIHHGYLRG